LSAKHQLEMERRGGYGHLAALLFTDSAVVEA
jgi:hypothetical protein